MKTKLYKILGVALTVVLLASLTVGLTSFPAGAETSNLKFTKLDMPQVEDWNDEASFAASEGDYWVAPATDVGPIAQTPEGDILFAGVHVGGEGLFYYVDETITGDDLDIDVDYDNQWGASVVVNLVIPQGTTAGTGGFVPLAPYDRCTDLDGITENGATTNGWVEFYSTASWTFMGEYDCAANVYYNGGTVAGMFDEVLKSLDGGYSWRVTGFYDEWNAEGDGTPVIDVVTSPGYDDDTTVVVATWWGVYISDDGGKNFILIGDVTNDFGGGLFISDLDVVITDDDDLAIMVGLMDGGGNGEVFIKEGLLDWNAELVGADVLASSFLPTFAADGNIGICAVVTDSAAATWMTFSFEDIQVGGGWGTTGISNAPITDAEGADFPSEWARTAFPDDFDAFGVGNNVCFIGVCETGALGAATLPVTPPDGSDAYKIICKEAGPSTAVDLDVRGVVTTLLPTATAITSIDVCGNADEATILVGTDVCNLTDTPTYFFAYMSEDSGDSFAPAAKQPTGGDEMVANLAYVGAMTQVLMEPDFCAGSTAYFATLGIMTSAFQRTTDSAKSVNQISIIDYGWGDGGGYWITNYGFSATGYNADGTLMMITSLDWGDFSPFYCAMWHRIDGNWERILSYASPGVTDNLFQISAPGDGSALFAADLNNACMWRSTDGGATWPKKVNTKPGLMWVTAVSSTTIYTAHVAGLAGNSGIWWTTKSGTGWNKPEDSEIPNAAVVAHVSVMGDIVYCATFDGEVYISSDGGETFENVGKNDPGVDFGPPTLASTDLGFAANGIMYAVSPMVADYGVWRIAVDLDDPGDNTWERIDIYQDSTDIYGPTDRYYDETTTVCASPAIVLPPSGVLYVCDADAAGGTGDNATGGIWRSTNPTADLDSVRPPYFERENRGLDNNAVLGLRGLDLAPPALAPTFFFFDYNANYDEQLWIFTDILNVGVPLASPAADETGVGLLPEGYVYPEVTLFWQEMSGATSYQYQVAIDPDFKTVVDEGFTDSLASPPMDLQPNTDYYWRVRVADQGSLIGAPLISPWSEVWKFKTAIGASMARPELQAPWPGEPDVSLSPTFEWSGIEWAEVYEYELAIDPTTTAGGYFTEPLVALVGTNSLVSTAWKCDITLDYNTRYYWHVKAIGVDTDTPWSDVGTFTTISPPPEPGPPPEQIVIPPAEQITPAWIWAVVIIGAILVIAVIVLIVTTRRVP